MANICDKCGKIFKVGYHLDREEITLYFGEGISYPKKYRDICNSCMNELTKGIKELVREWSR